MQFYDPSHRGPWRSSGAVEYATLEWADRFKNRHLIEPVGNIPQQKPRPISKELWNSTIFIREAEGGHLLVVKATRSGEGLFMKSFRRINADPAERARLIRQIERRRMDDGAE